MIKKLQLLGGNEITCNWLLSLQSDRTHFVRIGNFASDLLSLKYGCPQGSVLSPLIYTIYTADLEHWLDNDSIDIAIIYADDATVIAIGPNENECIKNSKTYPIAINVILHQIISKLTNQNQYSWSFELAICTITCWVVFVSGTIMFTNHLRWYSFGLQSTIHSHGWIMPQMLWAIYESEWSTIPPGSKGP